MKKIFIATILLLLGVGQMNADITVYVTGKIFVGKEAWDNSTSTIKIDARYQGSEDNFNASDAYMDVAMTNTGYTYNGYPIYSYTFTPNNGGGQYRFKHYKSGTWQEDYTAAWSTENGKIYDGYYSDAHHWITYGRDITIYAIPEDTHYGYSPAFDVSTKTLKANIKYGDSEWITPTMTKTDYKYNGSWIYEVTFCAAYNVVKIIQFQVHGNSGWERQYEIDKSSSQYSADDIDGKIFGGYVDDDYTWYDYGTDVTLDRQSGTTGSTSVTATVGSDMPAATMPTRTGYTFGGYFTEVDGGGDQYYNADGTSHAEWIMNGPTTLYAKWTAKTYTITLKDNGGSGGDASVTATYDAGLPSFTAASRDGYVLTGYWTATSNGTKYINADGTLVPNISGYTDASGHWIKVGTASLYAQWAVEKAPKQEYLYRTSGGTGYVSGFPKSAAASGNTTFELRWQTNFFAIQQYEIPNFAQAKTITLTLHKTGNNHKLNVWAFPYEMATDGTNATAFFAKVKSVTGIAVNDVSSTAFTNLPIVSTNNSGDNWTFTISAALVKPVRYEGTTAIVNLLLSTYQPSNTTNTHYSTSNNANDASIRPKIQVTYLDDNTYAAQDYMYRFTTGKAWNGSTPKTGLTEDAFETQVGKGFFTLEQFCIIDYDPAKVYTLRLFKSVGSGNMRVWDYPYYVANLSTDDASSMTTNIEAVTGVDLTEADASRATSTTPIANVAVGNVTTNYWTMTIPGTALHPVMRDTLGNRYTVNLLLSAPGMAQTKYATSKANNKSERPTLTLSSTSPFRIGSTMYATFEDAYSAASAGDTIVVCADWDRASALTIAKAIVIRGRNKGITLTRETGISGSAFITITAAATIMDLTIAGDESEKTAGVAPIVVSNTSNIDVAFKNVTFKKFGNNQNIKGIVAVEEKSEVTFTDVAFSDCHPKSGSGDIYVGHTSRNAKAAGTFNTPEGVYIMKSKRLINSGATYSPRVTLYLEPTYVDNYAIVTQLPLSTIEEQADAMFSIGNDGWTYRMVTSGGNKEIKLDTRNNYFMGSVASHETEWNNTSNWDKDRVPVATDSVHILKPVIIPTGTTAHAALVDIAVDGDCTPGTKSKISASGHLTIAAGGALVVTNTVNRVENAAAMHTRVATTPDDILLQSDGTNGNATLIFNNSNSCQATVQMYSKGYTNEEIGGSGTWNWQMIGVPVTDATRINDYYGGYMYKWSSSGWADQTNTEEALTPFLGYSATYPTTAGELHTYSIDGTLVATGDKSIDIPAKTSIQAVANSWTAPIYVKNITFTNCEPANIYIYNTGYGTATKDNDVANRFAAGTYHAVPVNASPYTGDSLISSMQGFYVRNKTANNGSMTINYSSVVRPSGDRNINAGQMHAPKRQMDEVGEPMVMKLFVSDSEHDDRIILLERSDFSRGFDNGWDGEKFQVNAVKTAPRLFAINESGGKEAVSAIPEIEGTVIGFRPGTESNYTISFEYSGAETFYLFDTNTGFTTLIGDETEYTFTSNGANEDARFVISRTPAIATGMDQLSGNSQTTDVRKLLIGDMLYIERAGQVYTIEGTPVK